MVRREEAKTASLILTFVCMALYVACSVFGDFDLAKVAIGRDCTVLVRLVYSFFHASMLHTFVNCWCLLTVVFIYDVSLTYLALAYLIAVTYPVSLFAHLHGDVPTVGLSAVCFALIGMVSFQTRRKALFHTWVLSFIAIGFAIPLMCSACGLDIARPNNWLHLYSYTAGLMVGFLNSPAPWQK